MTIILKEGYDQRKIFDERQLVEYVNDKHAVACSLHDDCEHPENPQCNSTSSTPLTNGLTCLVIVISISLSLAE